jgi:hypothetical protein
MVHRCKTDSSCREESVSDLRARRQLSVREGVVRADLFEHDESEKYQNVSVILACTSALVAFRCSNGRLSTCGVASITR